MIPDNAPQWLKDAKTKNADVSIVDGYVIWKNGRFLGGRFEGGRFLGGRFEGGRFLGGSFEGGRFLGGRFEGGSFEGGRFEGGWFEDGSFEDGSFEGGRFEGGRVEDNTWLSTISKWSIVFKGDIVRIGCKAKTIEEWDEWFKSSEEFDTYRNTQIFQMIHAHYQAIKTYKEFMK